VSVDPSNSGRKLCSAENFFCVVPFLTRALQQGPAYSITSSRVSSGGTTKIGKDSWLKECKRSTFER